MAEDRTNPEADDLVQRVQGEGVTWVEIASTGGGDEAKLLQGFLEAEGIPAQIENVEFHEMPTNFGAMGDIRIYVASEDEPRALQLLRERQEEYEQLEDDDDTLITDEGPAEIDENAEPEAEPEET
jgi:hypothetical protein